MDKTLLLIGLMSAFCLSCWLPFLWRLRRSVAVVAIIIEIAAAWQFAVYDASVWSILFASATIYQIVNFAKVNRNRIQETYLKSTSLRTALVLTVVQIVMCVAAAADDPSGVIGQIFMYVLLVGQILLGCILLTSTSRHLRTTRTLQAIKAYTDRELPAVSVLIPARNETDDLHACLNALIASNYPKLEIIVLDDCSQTRQTPEIIRSFAHDGVRFIAGEAPNESWLAKNFAYQQLADAASGDYLLFCGVDLRMHPGAIRELITTMLEKQKTMLSILPKNAPPRSLQTLLIQPMRYAWELSLPRRLFNRPPVLSTCWIITREQLLRSGSFKATSRSISPESYFAHAAARHDGYSFLRSNLLVSDKTSGEQRATAIRMRYPQLHRRPELVWAVTLIESFGLILPLPLAFILAWQAQLGASILAALAFGLYYIVILQVTAVMYGRPVLAVGFWQPLYDVILMNYSMIRYEFADVVWKERNVCLPVMRIGPSLPVASNQARRS